MLDNPSLGCVATGAAGAEFTGNAHMFFVGIVVIAWLFVTLLMAVAEATSVSGTLLGAVVTFVLYGALPLSLVVYLLTAPARKALRRTQDIDETNIDETEH